MRDHMQCLSHLFETTYRIEENGDDLRIKIDSQPVIRPSVSKEEREKLDNILQMEFLEKSEQEIEIIKWNNQQQIEILKDTIKDNLLTLSHLQKELLALQKHEYLKRELDQMNERKRRYDNIANELKSGKAICKNMIENKFMRNETYLLSYQVYKKKTFPFQPYFYLLSYQFTLNGDVFSFSNMLSQVSGRRFESTQELTKYVKAMLEYFSVYFQELQPPIDLSLCTSYIIEKISRYCSFLGYQTLENFEEYRKLYKKIEMETNLL